jgi:diguanylate cyclase (GGDEF)-like protein
MVERRGKGDRRLARLAEANARLRRQLAEQASFWRIAHQDPLTELWNRRYADERLTDELTRAGDEEGYRFSLVAADVNDLKRINDRDGHAAGDQALKWVAKVLAGAVRADDVLCRIGGDEFLVILPGTDGDECCELLRRLRAALLQAARAHGQAVALSLGAASYPTHGATIEALSAAADASMYADKRRSYADRRRSHADRRRSYADKSRPGPRGPRATARQA